MYKKRKLLGSSSEDIHDSPECVTTLPEPVRDLYSSDDKERNLDLPINTKSKSMVLCKTTNSSEITAAEVLFFFDLDYISLKNPSDLSNASVEKILESMFIFTYEDGIDTVKVNSDYRWKGKTMGEVYHSCLNRVDWLNWMQENDTLNFKLCTSQEWLEKKTYYRQTKMNGDDLQCNNIEHVIDFINIIKIQYSKNGCKDYEKVRNIFRVLGSVIPKSSNIRYDANANYKFHYRVNEDIASDKFPLSTDRIFPNMDRNVEIIVNPDSVFDVYINHKDPGLAKLVVQIYAPEKESNTNSVENMEEYENNQVFQKPLRKTDAVLPDKYKLAACDYIRQSIPNDCKNDHCLNKIAGQHVLELICVASERKKELKVSSTYKAVGMFMKNEYIYFSKLVVDKDKLETYSKPQFVELLVGIDYEKCEESCSEGQISYSGWRIDMTVANHRKAFMTFILMFLSIEGSY